MSSSIERILQELPRRYRRGTAGSRVYYLSIGPHKATVRLSPDACVVEPGKTVEHADIVLKTTPELFEKMVVRGKLPGPVDIALGRVRTNDPLGLQRLRDCFDFSGL
jgi:long-chain acyl-CoA synthetase